MKRIRLNESQFNRLVSKCVKRVLREQDENVKAEAEQFLNDEFGCQIAEWGNDHSFEATNGCNGYIFNGNYIQVGTK